MVRTTIEVMESAIDEVAAPGDESVLREALLVYAREIAFATAQVYAQAAEARGAWDARLESLVVNAVLSGEADEGAVSRAAALLDEDLQKWRSRPLGEFKYLILDARYEKVRHGGSIVDCAVFTAIGVDPDGRRSVSSARNITCSEGGTLHRGSSTAISGVASPGIASASPS